MATFKISGEDYIRPPNKGFSPLIKKAAFESFNPTVLGLGDIKQDSQTIPAISAFFDLQGFTAFSKQIDPHLAIPYYLNDFLEWIFESIRRETQMKEKDGGVTLWHDLPFYAKFMGDGLLFLWNTSLMSLKSQHNLVISLKAICRSYETAFVPKIKRRVADPPQILRCGVAKGSIYSVGNGEDFVGPCINMSARLQKLPLFSFAFACRGFDPEGIWPEDTRCDWTLITASVKGIGDNELVCVPTDQLESLSPADKDSINVV